jgi:hypothetical protein
MKQLISEKNQQTLTVKGLSRGSLIALDAGTAGKYVLTAGTPTTGPNYRFSNGQGTWSSAATFEKLLEQVLENATVKVCVFDDITELGTWLISQKAVDK